MRISDWSLDVCSSDLQTCLSRSTLAVSGKTCSEWSVIRMSLGQQLQPHLPFLRRYGRALTGSQTHGDAYVRATRSEEHTSELQSLMRISYAVFCLKKKKKTQSIIELRMTNTTT